MLSAACVFGCTGSSVGLMTPLLPALCFQLDMSPGYCWPLKASQSQVVFNLPTKVQPTAVTVQHSVETNLWHVSSAPRDFAVFVSVCWYMGLGCGCRETPPLGDILEKRTSTSLEQCSRGDSAPPHSPPELQELLELRRPRFGTSVDLLPCALSRRAWMRKERRKLCLGNSPMMSGKR